MTIPATATVTNLHQPRIDGTAVRCSAPGCYHVTFGYLLPTEKDDPERQESAKENFRRAHTATYEPGRAPDIEVDWRVVATCSVCHDGGDVDTSDSETVECSQCHTTWYIDGTGGERRA